MSDEKKVAGTPTASLALGPDEKPLLYGWNLLLAIGITFVYLLIGAAIFYAAEHDYAVQSRKDFNSQRNSLISEGNFNDSQKAIVEELMTMAAQDDYSPYLEVWSEEHDPEEIWSYGESLYFTLVTLSTVGYGDMSPRTDGGKAFLILFTIVGIPLMITVNLSLGGYVLQGGFAAVQKMNRWRHWKLETKSPITVELVLLSLLILVALLLTFIFAAILQVHEKWSYFDAFYFTWSTLTTIGYGDLTIENNHFVTASFALIILLSISFAAGSALVAILVRTFNFTDMQKERATISQVHLVEEEAAAANKAAVEMKELGMQKDSSQTPPPENHDDELDVEDGNLEDIAL